MVNGKEQEKERKPRIVPPDTRLMTLEIQNQPSSEDGDLWAISGQGKEKENERKPRIVPTDTWLRVPGNSKLTILRGWYPWVTESLQKEDKLLFAITKVLHIDLKDKRLPWQELSPFPIQNPRGATYVKPPTLALRASQITGTNILFEEPIDIQSRLRWSIYIFDEDKDLIAHMTVECEKSLSAQGIIEAYQEAQRIFEKGGISLEFENKDDKCKAPRNTNTFNHSSRTIEVQDGQSIISITDNEGEELPATTTEEEDEEVRFIFDIADSESDVPLATTAKENVGLNGMDEHDIVLEESKMLGSPENAAWVTYPADAVVSMFTMGNLRIPAERTVPAPRQYLTRNPAEIPTCTPTQPGAGLKPTGLPEPMMNTTSTLPPQVGTHLVAAGLNRNNLDRAAIVRVTTLKSDNCPTNQTIQAGSCKICKQVQHYLNQGKRNTAAGCQMLDKWQCFSNHQGYPGLGTTWGAFKALKRKGLFSPEMLNLARKVAEIWIAKEQEQMLRSQEGTKREMERTKQEEKKNRAMQGRAGACKGRGEETGIATALERRATMWTPRTRVHGTCVVFRKGGFSSRGNSGTKSPYDGAQEQAGSDDAAEVGNRDHDMEEVVSRGSNSNINIEFVPPEVMMDKQTACMYK
ncbi:hypothetical protein BKA70DRAFT_1221930 [Coprinopsis sp. MPI-PUGE-AT-0042]|nr:hypothetical protein BKA70DRAFT_1221930 [Coprinopsis sp. MPI-PUGE-AT-0042]